MHYPALYLPCLERLIRQLAIGVTESLCQSSAAADPRAIPALSIEVAENRDCQHSQGDAPSKHEQPQIATTCQVAEVPRVEEVIVQWPDIFKVIIGLVQPHKYFRYQESKSTLEEHERERAHLVIGTVPVFDKHPYAHHHNGQRIDEAVHEPLTGRSPIEHLAERVGNHYHF